MSQVWLITGSSRGLGRAFAEAALSSGFQVAATARNTEDLEELKDKYGDLVLPLSLDITSETQACEAVKTTIRLSENSMFWSITLVTEMLLLLRTPRLRTFARKLKRISLG